MNDADRILGSLQEFKESTNRRLDEMKRDTEKRHDSLEQKVDSLQEFKWKSLGVLAMLSAIIGLAAQILLAAGR